MHQLLTFSLLLISTSTFADTSLRLPPGFSIETLTDQADNARQLALHNDSNTLFIGSMRAGNVYRLKLDAEGATPEVIAKGLTAPSGIALRGDDLYVAALNQVLVLKDAVAGQPTRQLITDRLPTERHHGWKYLAFGPDEHLYVPVGAPCNICLSADPRFASILRMHPETGETTVYAAGVRNSVGMAWHPGTGELWFSDNGRDMLGDDVPAEEINVVTRPGAHFGYPFVHAGDIRDPEFGASADPAHYIPPRIRIQAHSAALGLAFNTHGHFPAEYAGALFIAEHGSWNRSSKVGYRVSVVTFDAVGNATYQPFIEGWLAEEKNWGRPVDVLFDAQGRLLISDDQANSVYRVSYNKPLSSD